MLQEHVRPSFIHPNPLRRLDITTYVAFTAETAVVYNAGCIFHNKTVLLYPIAMLTMSSLQFYPIPRLRPVDFFIRP
jgi:hypothetical protein